MKRFALPAVALAALSASTAMSPTRGMISSMRAETKDPATVLAELQRVWEAFKAEHSAEIAAIRKDVVQSEKVDRINAEIQKLQEAVNAQSAKLAALDVSGTGGASPRMTAEQRAHAKAFNHYFRKGIDAGLRDLEVKASLSTDSDPDGGYVTSAEIEQTIDRVLTRVSAMRSLARVVTISSGTYKKPFNLGGADSGWVGERQARTQTNTPQLSELAFPVMELYAMPAATQTLLDDARIDIAQWLADEVTIIFAEQEGGAFISGDGVNKPKGLLAYGTVADDNWAWGKLGYVGTGGNGFAADPDGLDALIDLTTALKPGYRGNASWLMNRKTEGAARKLKDAQGHYQWEPSNKVGVPATLLGYPVAVDDNMDDLGAGKYPVAFGDFQRGYLIVDRYGIRVLRDPFTAKPYVLFYTTKRVGGGVQNFEAIKLLKCA